MSESTAIATAGGDQPPTAKPEGGTLATLERTSMPVSIALYLDDALYERVSAIALRISKADGMTPKHLLGKPEACFAVVSRAITWKLDPFAVAMATYQTPGGSIGFEGKLVHAIIENSGRLDPRSGGVRLEYKGDWSKVQGKFKIVEKQKEGEKTTKYTVPTWTDEDAVAGGCGIIVRARLSGEPQDRVFEMDLVQCFPRNSTLWATDPKTQLGYTAIRRFASVAAPALIMGVPFDVEDYATAPERDMGAAVVVKEEVAMPTRKPTPTPDDKPAAAAGGPAPTGEQIDKSTGEISSATSTATASASAASSEGAKPQATAQTQAPQASAAPASPVGPQELALPNQVATVRKMMGHASITEVELQRKFGFDLEHMPRNRVNEVLAWVNNPN